MIGSVIGLPLRLTRCGAGIALDTAAAVAGRGLGLAGHLADAVTGDREPDLDLDGSEHVHDGGERANASTARVPEPREPKQPQEPEEPQEPQEPQEPREPREATVAPTAPTQPEAEPEPLEPTHVSEEATLVDESADPGAEDGAGAEVHVAEPWPGYRELRADDVLDRIRAASTAELAAVELYELSHRRRQAVLTAVQRELARADRDDPDRRAGDEGQ